MEVNRRENTSFCHQCTVYGKLTAHNLVLGSFETALALMSYEAGLYSADNAYIGVATNLNPNFAMVKSIVQIAIPTIITAVSGSCVQTLAKKIKLPSAATTMSSIMQIFIFAIKGCDLIRQHESNYPEQAGMQTRLKGGALIAGGMGLICLISLTVQNLMGLKLKCPNKKALMATSIRTGIGSAISMHYYDFSSTWNRFLDEAQLSRLLRALERFEGSCSNKTIYKMIKEHLETFKKEGITLRLNPMDEMKLHNFCEEKMGPVLMTQLKLLYKNIEEIGIAIRNYDSSIVKTGMAKDVLRSSVQSILDRGLFFNAAVPLQL